MPYLKACHCAGERIYHWAPPADGKRSADYRERLARALAQGAARGRVAKGGSAAMAEC